MSLDDTQFAQICGFNNFYLIDLISQRTADVFDVEFIPQSRVHQFSEQLGFRQSSVSCQDCVCIVTTDWERCPFHMPDAFLQNSFGRPGVNRHIQNKLRDDDGRSARLLPACAHIPANRHPPVLAYMGPSMRPNLNLPIEGVMLLRQLKPLIHFRVRYFSY